MRDAGELSERKGNYHGSLPILPQNVDDLRREKLEAEERVRVIAKQEAGLKKGNIQ